MKSKEIEVVYQYFGSSLIYQKKEHNSVKATANKKKLNNKRDFFSNVEQSVSLSL